MAYHDTSVALLGSGEVSAEVHQFVNVPALNVSGSLDASSIVSQYVNSYLSLYGFLTASLESMSECNDIIFNMEPPEIEMLQCTLKGDLVELNIFKDNTYPVKAKLSIKGDYNISGHTIRMSTQIADGTIYTTTGTITDGASGSVEFELHPDAVSIIGVGSYDIEGNDGSYVYTYGKDTLNILDNLTVPV